MNDDILRRWAAGAVWLLPVYGALTLATTVSQQPDPAADIPAWSEYVTTTWLYISHEGPSLLGLAMGTIAVVGLGVLLAGGQRPRAALVAVVLHVLGAAFVTGMFGVAAFVQPAMGETFLGGQAIGEAWYHAVFDSPRTLVPAVVGLVAFSSASVVMAWSLASHPRIPRWVAVLFGATAPFVGLLGLVMSPLQPVGGGLLGITGVLIALRLSPVAQPMPAGARQAR